MRVLVVPDKFKGTLSAASAARAIARGWRRARPEDRLELLPMSDGGDGFGPVLGALLGARARSAPVVDAAGRPGRARWWWAADRRWAVIEAAQANGLAQLPKGRYHPFELDTRGVGQLVRAALRRGARQCLIGVGGSATNDGGFGMARELGWRFLDGDGHEIERWTDLVRLARIVPPSVPLPRCRFVVATDVDNPLLGTRGASRVYGPQKGLTPDDFPTAEAALRRASDIVRRQLGIDGRSPGSGAAGGLGFGIRAFLGGERELGFELFARLAKIEARLARADLVITGEGSFDRQSLMGKGVGQLIALARRRKRPVVVLAGRLSVRRRDLAGIPVALGLCDRMDPEAAMRQAAPGLRRLAAEAAMRWTTPS